DPAPSEERRTEEQATSPTQGALEKARAEIGRLNALNLEQQALLDERYGVAAREDGTPVRKGSSRGNDRDSAARARATEPITKRSHSAQPSRAADSPTTLTAALARRDDIQAALTRLQDSPADGSAPARAAELQAELDSVNAEIRRLTVLLNVEASTR